MCRYQRTWDGSFRAHTVPEKQYLKSQLSQGWNASSKNDDFGSNSEV